MREYGISVTMGRLPREMRNAPAHMVERSQRAAITAALPYMQRRLSLVTPTGATGKARQSVTMERGLTGATGFVGFGGAPSLYMGFVNDGTRPHWPPIEAMSYWAARKFGYPVGSPEARRMGYLVARSISRKGTKPQRFIETLVARERGRVQAMMSGAALQALHERGR
jgi:hypothetical protein